MLIRLPGGVHTDFKRPSNCKIATVKDFIEELYGIPCELQLVSWKVNNVDDQTVIELEDDGRVNEVSVSVEEEWHELVSLCLAGDRKCLPKINSIITDSKHDVKGIFGSLLICARRGLPSFLNSILATNSDFDLRSTTTITGRTVLHAAVKSGSLKCVEEIKKIAGMKFERLLNIKNKFGSTPLDCLHRDQLRMINYINKFISNPISLNDLEQQKNSHEQRKDDDIQRQSNNTETDGAVKHNMETLQETEQTSACTDIINQARQPISDQSCKGIISNHVKITRSKIDKNDQGAVSQASNSNDQGAVSQASNSNEGGDDHSTVSVSPIISENVGNTRTLKIGEALQHQSVDASTLPIIATENEVYKSPRTRRKGSALGLNNTLLPVMQLNTPAIAQPHPPLAEKKKKPVAGVLKESNARKYSAARNTHNKTDGKALVQNQIANFRRPLSSQKVLIVPAAPVPRHDEKNPPTTEKVRRISRIQNPRHTTDLENGSTNHQKVIEIEKDRIEKPWNIWIKAVTVDADSELAASLLTPPINQEKVPVKKKFSLLVQSDSKSRKQSFDQWVLYKTQLEIAESQKSRDEEKHKDINENEAKRKRGKTFEQWKKEKEDYDKLLQEQKENDEKENKPPRQYLKGKTFEQWQQEKEERERLEAEEKKIKEAKGNEEMKNNKNRRRKESSAKYQQWLLDKEMQELEKEMQARQSIASRKTSTKRTFTNVGRKRRSMTS